MRHEIAVAGLFLPSLLGCLVLAVLLWVALDRLLTRTQAWSLFWHPPLARFALLVALFATVALLAPDP